MAITKEKKETVVSELNQELSQAQSVTFVAFDKLSVAEANDLRRTLYSNGVEYQVVKKTLLNRALSKRNLSGSIPSLQGNIAITWSTNDVTASSREVVAWKGQSKNRKDVLTILGGIFESRLISADEMMEIATIPDMHTLRGMFVNVINSPIQRMAIALDQIAQKKSA